MRSLWERSQVGKHDADAFHIAEGYKYGTYFVTFEKRLLNLRQKIAQLRPGMAILKPSELLQIVHDYRVGRPSPDFGKI